MSFRNLIATFSVVLLTIVGAGCNTAPTKVELTPGSFAVLRLSFET